MRIKVILLAMFLLSVPFMAMADEAMDLKKKIMLDSKKLVVLDNIEFTDKEAKAFWPVYENHQEKLFQVNQKAAKLIRTYASAYQTMTDEQAIKLVDEYYKIQDERLAIMKSMAADTGKVLPGKKAFRYMQVEHKINVIALFELAKEIPLAQ